MRFLRTLLAVLLGAFTPVAALAQSAGTNSSQTLINPLGTQSLWQLTINVMNFIIQIGAVVIVFMVVYAGFLFVVARGNESKLSEAKKALLWTIIGALILLGAKAITLGVCETVKAFSTNTTITCPTTF